MDICKYHTKRIARDIHILSFQHNSVLSFRRMESMINEIGKPAMLEQMAEECSELTQALLKYARKLRKENPTPKSESEIKRNLIEEYSDVIQCARELGLQPDEEQIKEKAERFKVRWIAKVQSDVAKKVKANKKFISNL
jgi:NTP pyrophosphatase (non-canonical NTP hydrolase)